MSHTAMKKLFYIFTILPFCLFTACTIEGSDNGDLDGYWRLESIDTIATGGRLDVSRQGVFWGVQGRLIQMDGGSDSYYYRFRQTADSLVLLTPYLNRGHEDVEGGGDLPVSDVAGLRQYGLQHFEEHYLKESLTSGHMTLRSDSLRLSFTKF